MNVEVRMPHDGDMTMDCSACDFDVTDITAYDSDGNELTDGNLAAESLAVYDLVHGGDYLFVIEGAPDVSEGKFDCKIECTSDAPTTAHPSASPTAAPTGLPTAAPSTSPSPAPTGLPTPAPSTSPTGSPTADPTADPTVDPTADPTADPTSDPTSEPTLAPTPEPSDSPTTPAPTHPGEKTCDSELSGSYNGEPMNVEVRMPYDGDLTMDCTESDFDIGSVTAYDSDNNELTDVDYAASILTVHDLVHGGDHWFTIDGADGVSSGNFDCIIQCSSDSPTTSPTTDPTNAPTGSPTKAPTKRPTGSPTTDPTDWPTVSPSDSPTFSPTAAPTSRPSQSPTTPAPTHPGELTCGDHDTGDYNGEPMEIEVRMPYDGDLTMNCSGSDFEIGSITAYDSDGNELTDADAAESILTVHDLGHGGDYTFIVEGGPYAPSGIYDCAIECSSDAPTGSPTVDPTAAPSSPPTVEPTVDPSADPTTEPTLWPTVTPTPEPTTSPTPEPSVSPTTPAPTHPGEKICGDHFNGTYHGEPMNVEVRMPYDGDMRMDCSACDFDVTDITAYDSDGNELTDSNLAAESLAVSLYAMAVIIRLLSKV